MRTARSPQAPDGRSGPERAWFLVELRTCDGTPQDVAPMVRALRLAVSRQASARAGIGWVSALLVPSDRSCLCLLEAVEIAQVIRARDVAGLHAAPVRRAYPLTDPLGGDAYDDRAVARHLPVDVPHLPKELP